MKCIENGAHEERRSSLLRVLDSNKALRRRCARYWNACSCLALALLLVVFWAKGSVDKARAGQAEALEATVAIRAKLVEAESREKKILAGPITADYIGEFHCTAYCTEKRPHICGTGDGITASGQPVQAGVSVATTDHDLLPYGTVLYIEGVGVRIVQDTGAFPKDQLDVAVETHEDALNWAGYGSHAVYVISTPAAE